jgi:phytoene dehydrogenase-like protein
MFRYGAPGIVEGGCGALTGELERRILEQGAHVRLRHDVLQILQEDGHVTGVRIRNKASGEECVLHAPLVVSDIGPRATSALLSNHSITQAEVLKKQGERKDSQEAIGLKVHILSDVSLIPHKGIMYCLDTQRIAGMVQPTNCDPRLAPAGKHLLISHQVIPPHQGDNIEAEKQLALADLSTLFGETFDKHCRVLTMSTYRGEWPVNRLAQGEDVAPDTSVQGLYLVGDAVKPSGYLMVEGVAQSVNTFLDLLNAIEELADSSAVGTKPGAMNCTPTFTRRTRNVIRPPSRLRALRWLWEAPGNS